MHPEIYIRSTVYILTNWDDICNVYINELSEMPDVKSQRDEYEAYSIKRQ